MKSVVGLLIVMVAFAGCTSDKTESTDDAASPSFVTVVDAEGDAAAPLDVVWGMLSETESAILADIHVKHLENDIGAQVAGLGYDWAELAICWEPFRGFSGNQMGRLCAGVELPAISGGDVAGFLDSAHGPEEGCNDWQWCSWKVSASATPGTPGMVQVEIPKWLLPNTTVGHTLNEPFLASWGGATQGGLPGDRWAYGYVCTGVVCPSQGAGFPTYVFDEDTGSSGENLTLQQEYQSPPAPDNPSVVLRDPTGDMDNADYDLTTVAIEETSTGISLIANIANLPLASMFSVDMEIGIGATVYEAWFDGRAGQAINVGGGYCATPACDRWIDIEPTAELTAGTPGTIKVTLPWNELLPATPGTRITLTEFELGEGMWFYQTAPGFVGVHAQVASPWDWAYRGEPYHLTIGSGT